MKTTIVLIIVLLMSTWLSAQELSNVDSLIIEGKAMLRHAQQRWQEADHLQTRAYFERLLSATEHQDLIHYYLALADLRLAFFYMDNDNKELAKQYVDEGIKHTERAIEINENLADAYSLQSSLIGNKIGLSPMKGMFLGPKIGRASQKALEIDPYNPRNHLIAGQSAYYTPVMFGGGKDKAAMHFKRAIVLFDSIEMTDAIMPDWGHDEAYTWLGIYYRDKGDTSMAIEQFNNALKVNPENGWVRYSLLPAITGNQAAAKSQ